MRPRLPRLPRPLQHRERSHARSETEEIHQATAHGSSSTEIANTPHMSPAGDIEGLWRAALDEYRRSYGIDLCDPNDNMVFDFHQCRTSEAILEVLQKYSDILRDSREGGRVSRVLRESLRPLIDGISVVLDAGAETASALGVPGGKGVFAAFAILLRAVKNVSRDFDDIVRFLNQLRGYIERLQVRLRKPGHLSDEAKAIVVKAFVKMLEALVIATRMLERGRLGQFVRVIFSSKDNLQTAIASLEDIESEEERLQITELAVEMFSVAEGVHDIKISILELQMGVGAVQTGFGAMQDRFMAVEDRLMLMEDMLLAIREATGINSSRLLADINTQQSSRSVGTYSHASAREPQIASPRYATTDYFSLGLQLRGVISRFSVRDRDILWRGISTMLGWVADAARITPDSKAGGVITAALTVTVLNEVAATLVPMVLTFIVLFGMLKLATVSRPLGSSPDDVVLVDVLGKVYRLHFDTFSTWENTHTFLLDAFKGRAGDAYVRRREYGLGNAQHAMIERDAWSEVVQRGAWLKMSIIVRERFSQCPYCRTATTGHEASSDDGRTICSACELPYSMVQSRAGTDLSKLEVLNQGSPMTSANQSPPWMWTWPSSTPSLSPSLTLPLSEDTELDTPGSPVAGLPSGSPQNSITKTQPPSSRNSSSADEGPLQEHNSPPGRDMKQFQRIVVEFRPSVDENRRSVPLHALIIGIDKYQSGRIPDLSGAVADADAFDAYLRDDLHVPWKQIVNLRNEQATRNTVIQEIRALSNREDIRRGDPILIYFAGHGTATLAPREWHIGNQSVPLIAPHDLNPTLEAILYGAISVRTIDALLHDLAERLGEDENANITVIFDCCHSGKQSDDSRRARGFTSQITLPAQLDEDIWDQGQSVNVARGFAHSSTRSHILFSACRDTESAFENNGRGYFTHELLSALRQVEINKVTYQDLMRLISNNIAGQTPQCEGYNVNRVLFNARVLSQRRAVYEVHRRRDTLFVVNAGSVHGVTDGTIFAVYTASDLEVDSQPVATMTVVKVHAFTTELRYRDGRSMLDGFSTYFAAPSSLGLAGVLRLHVADPANQDQHCVLEAVEKVVQAHQAKGDPTILLRNDPAQANISVCAAEGDVTYTIHDPSIADRGLSQLCRTTRAEVGAIQPVLSAAARFFWHLHHAPKKGQLRDRIEIRIYELEPDEDAFMGPDLKRPYMPRDPDLYNSGVVDVIADEETPYGILVRNNSTVPLHVWAFYFNCSTLAIHEYYRPLAVERNAAGSLPAAKCKHIECDHSPDEIDSMKGELTIGYGAGGGQPCTFVIPDDDPDLDVGFIKLFISTEPVDLSSIVQPSPFDMAINFKPRLADGVWDTFTIAMVQHKP